MCDGLRMPNSDELIISASEAAEILDVSVDTVCRWAERGDLPAIRKLPGVSGAWIFDTTVVRRKATERLLKNAG